MLPIFPASGEPDQYKQFQFQLVTSFPPSFGYDGLSELLGRDPGTLRADLSRKPASVPPPIRIKGVRSPIWLLGDVLEWLEDKKQKSESVAVPRQAGPGRPSKLQPRRGASTKAERVEAARLGITVAVLRSRQGALEKKGGAQ